MRRLFKNALAKVLIHEGGWADHPRDPGGATMRGVTLVTFRRYFGDDKGKEDLRNITDEQLTQIYRSGYWDKCCCNDLPAGVDYTAFDSAVNSGPARGAKWLQAAVGATQDGVIGDKTLAKVKEHNSIEITDDMCDLRLAFLRGLSNWSTFGRGWERRVEDVRAAAIVMAGGRSPEIRDLPPTTAYKTVKKGSRGLWVRKIQAALGIQVDGIFGKKTEAALKGWQAANGLQSDGIAGRVTYRAMGLI